MNKIVLKITMVTLCLLLGILAAAGQLNGAAHLVACRYMSESNDAYLKESFDKALTGFGTLSVLKAGLDIIEGSEVGANFGITANLEVGDIVQPAYDYVDIAWKTVLAGCVAILSIQYILQAANLIDQFALGCTMLLLALFLTAKWWAGHHPRFKAVLRDILSVSIVATFALYYILPFSVWGAAKLSGIITRPAIESATQGFEATRQALFPEEQTNAESITAKLRHMQDQMDQIATELKEKTRDMVIWSIQLITGYLFDCIVFPLSLFTLLLWLNRAILLYIFQRSSEASLRDNLAVVLDKGRKQDGA